MTLESPPNPVDSVAFQPLHDLNINALAIIPYAFSRNRQPEVYFNSSRQWWGERIDGAAKMIDIAHRHNLTVMLKPQVWVHRNWIGAFQLDSEAEWINWEEAYAEYILRFAEMAATHEVEIFCIGTEVKNAATSRPEYFRKLIREVRDVFPGKITYAANWDAYDSITFWDELDYIGVNAYFPLSTKKDPDLDELNQAWQPILANLEAVHSKFSKPVLITEFGYRSVDRATGNQWEIEDNAVNTALQSRAFQAFFESVYPWEWISGVFIWKWEFENRSYKYKDEPDRRYTPQGKVAAQTISEYFGEFEAKKIRRKAD